jgi:hypothetical protein
MLKGSQNSDLSFDGLKDLQSSIVATRVILQGESLVYPLHRDIPHFILVYI